MPSPLAVREFRMAPEFDAKAKIIKQIEDGMRARHISLSSDAEGIDRIQPLSDMLGIEIGGPDFLIAFYDRSGQYTAGKIFVPEAYLEDKVQGKVALVMGIGPLCNEDPLYHKWFRNNPPQVGDWVVASVRDGLTYSVCGVIMKTIEWKYIRMKIRYPDMVM